MELLQPNSWAWEDSVSDRPDTKELENVLQPALQTEIIKTTKSIKRQTAKRDGKGKQSSSTSEQERNTVLQNAVQQGTLEFS